MSNREVATFAGGCFWCIEGAYRELKGVHSATSGYMGGRTRDPTYEQICEGDTGHAEVVQVVFDPSILSYRELLEVFFTLHDPTTLNRQGNDVGDQYRSAIFTHAPQQEIEAQRIITELTSEGVYDDPIVTQIQPATMFYPAEEYHQDYFRKNPYQGYCVAVVRPKLAKFRKNWAAKLKTP